MKISLAMIVKNVGEYIERSLQSVMHIVDEVVIVDTGSTDNTVDILEKYDNVHFYQIEWRNDFSYARNFSIEKTSGDYVLVLDADEYLFEGSKNELVSLAQKGLIGRIQIISNFIKDNQTFVSSVYVSRFFPRDVRFVGLVHEQLDTKIKREKLPLKVKHDGYYKTNKGKRNIPLLLKTLKENPDDPYYLFQLGTELRIDKQYEKSYFFLKKSYLLSNKANSYFGRLVIELINCAKELGQDQVLEIISDNEEGLKNIADFHFAKGMYYLEYSLKYPNEGEEFLSVIEGSLLTCLELNSIANSEYLIGTSSFLPSYNLGVLYELKGNTEKAIKYYTHASSFGYTLAKKRLDNIVGHIG